MPDLFDDFPSCLEEVVLAVVLVCVVGMLTVIPASAL